MEKICKEYGKDMLRIWNGYLKYMKRICKEYGKDMESIWKGYGKKLEKNM